LVKVSRTTTVRLSDDDTQLLAELAPEFGGRSSAIRQGIRLLARESRRRQALRSFVEAWNEEAGPVDEGEISSMLNRYFKQ